MMRICLILCIFLTIFTPNFVTAQDFAKDSIKVNAFLAKADTSRKMPRLFTISDNKQVSFISTYIDNKHKQREELRLKQQQLIDSQTGVRYTKGDKTVIPQIVATLKSGDAYRIRQVLREMELPYEHNRAPHTIDAEVAQPIFDLVSNDSLEHLAVQFLGYNHIARGLEVMERRLLSGNSTEADRIFYWLVDYGKATKAVRYVLDMYTRFPTTYDGGSWMAAGLKDYFEKASAEEKKRIVDIAYAFLEKNPIDDWKIKRANITVFPDRAISPFLIIVLAEGTYKRTLPLMEKLLAYYNQNNDTPINSKDLDANVAEIYLKELPPQRQREIISAKISNQNTLSDGLRDMEEIPAMATDDELLRLAFSVFEKSPADASYFISQLPKMDYDTFSKYASGLKSEKNRRLLLDTFVADSKTFAQNNDYLISIGLTNKKITPADYPEIKKRDEFFEPEIQAMYSVLTAVGISVPFDTEASQVPVPYDELLDDFQQNSNGKFGPMKSWMQYRYDERSEQSVYRFLVICNGKCFVMVPEDSGDWFDMTAFPELIDALSTELQLTERFVNVDTGDQTAWYIFGKPETVKQLIDTYKLAVPFTHED